MAQYLPLLMQQLFNSYLAVSDRQAQLITSALAGRLDIRSIESETCKLDARGMRDLAAQGRAQADERNQHMNGVQAAMSTPEQDRYTGLWAGKTFPQVGRAAIIDIRGTLTRNWGLGVYSGTTGYDGIQTQVLDAMADETVGGIWLGIGSGGGAVDGCFDLQELIYNCSERRGGKPIFAMASDYAYSAAYALAVAADEVWVPRTGGVGSVGVLMLWADITRALDNEGIDVHVFRAGTKKALGVGGVETMPEAEMARHIMMMEEIRDHFAERVGEYRGIAKSTVLQTEGLDYMGLHAKANGFVTGVASELEVWARFQRKIA